MPGISGENLRPLFPKDLEETRSRAVIVQAVPCTRSRQSEPASRRLMSTLSDQPWQYRSWYVLALCYPYGLQVDLGGAGL